MLTPREAAAESGLHYHTIVKYIKAGYIEAIRLPSGYFRIPENSLQAFLDSLRINQAAAPKKKASRRARR